MSILKPEIVILMIESSVAHAFVSEGAIKSNFKPAFSKSIIVDLIEINLASSR